MGRIILFPRDRDAHLRQREVEPENMNAWMRNLKILLEGLDDNCGNGLNTLRVIAFGISDSGR